MDKKQYHAAKARLVAQMQEGQSWQAAAALAGIQTSQSTAYRLLQVVRKRGEARTFLAEHCGGAPHTASSTIQTLLQERFGLSVSISQINRVRAALGVSKRPKSQEQGKKQEA